jgi:hypothetical protein
VAFPLYGDENAMRGILFETLRASGVDCLTSNEAGNAGLSDDAQLAFATSEGRPILTYDKKDFSALHRLWMDSGREHAGIIIVSGRRVAFATLLGKLMRLQLERSAEDMRNAILFIGPTPPEEPK